MIFVAWNCSGRTTEVKNHIFNANFNSTGTNVFVLNIDLPEVHIP